MSVFLTAKLLKVICSDKDYADLYNLLAPKTYEMAYKRGFVSKTNMIPCVSQSCSVNLYEKIFKLLLHLIEEEAYWAVTKGGTGKWDSNKTNTTTKQIQLRKNNNKSMSKTPCSECMRCIWWLGAPARNLTCRK